MLPNRRIHFASSFFDDRHFQVTTISRHSKFVFVLFSDDYFFSNFSISQRKRNIWRQRIGLIFEVKKENIIFSCTIFRSARLAAGESFAHFHFPGEKIIVPCNEGVKCRDLFTATTRRYPRFRRRRRT